MSSERRILASDPTRLGAVQAWRAIQNRDLTAREYVEALLERIDERERIVQAWAHIAAESARSYADAADRRPSAALLHGLPVGVKDVVDVAGMPTRGGAPELYADDPAAEDAETVRNIRGHGAIVLGKTAAARYGMMIPGRTRNPHDPSRTPGASSSGSAAAVADGMIPFSLGTQTAGSLLRPATYCGVVGFKPTFGNVPYGGTRPLSVRLDTAGCIARNVTDASLLFAAMTDKADNFVSLPWTGQIRVGVFRAPDEVGLAPDAESRFELAVDILKRDGHAVEDLPLSDDTFLRLGDLQDLIARHDTRVRFAEYGFGSVSRLHPDLIDYCESAAHIDRAEYESALGEAARLRGDVLRSFEDVDVVITPATRTDAPLASTTGTSEFLRVWTLLGNPALNLPFGTSTDRLPLAVQLVGHPDHDRALLSIAVRIEQLLISG